MPATAISADTKFLLYFQRIAAVALPRSRFSKVKLYKIRDELLKEKRFSGRATLLQVIEHLSNTL